MLTLPLTLFQAQESQKGHESVFGIKRKCLLAAAAETQSSSWLWTQSESGWLQNCWVLSCRRCSADLQVYTFTALGILPAPCQSLRDIFHQVQNFRESVTIVLFLALTGEVRPSAIPELRSDHLSPTVAPRRAQCSSDAQGRGNCFQCTGGSGKQGDREQQKQANKRSGNGRAMLEGSRNPALLHLRSASESLKYNFMGMPYASRWVKVCGQRP